ncbi:Nuclear transport factor 2 family protein OS=Streptomyces violarus OX=67380 GN=FHS41_006427 PE=4 SV=1 [Streptomyces violarus]
MLAVCVLLVAGSAGCGSSAERERGGGASPTPVGRLLDDRDKEGRPYREVGQEDAPASASRCSPAWPTAGTYA